MPKTKRILLLCQHFYPEMISTGMHMTELSLALKKIGWKITVCCAQPSLSIEVANEKAPDEMELQGIRVVRVPTIRSNSKRLINRALTGTTFLLSCTLFIIKNVRRFDGLLITTNPPFLGVLGWMASSLLAKPYVMIVYDIYPDIAIRLGLVRPTSVVSRLWSYFTRLILRSAACNVVIGHDMQKIVARKLGPSLQNRTCLIPNWSDEEVVYPVPKNVNAFRQTYCGAELLLVQYSGRMARTHNLEPLLIAAELMRDDPVCFQFIGDGAKKKILQEMVSAKCLKNVQFLPYQPINRLNEVLSAADLAVVCLDHLYTGLSVPSKTYGILASATPILGFVDKESEIGRTILENKCGVVLDNPSAEEVVVTIRRLLINRDALQEMGQNGYYAFKKNYTLAIAAQRYSTLLTRCFDP